MNWGKAGREYWQNELQNMIGVKSGNTAPWELPEFKAMAGSYNSQANNNLNNIIRQLSQRGIQGGAASGVINNTVENDRSNLLKMIQSIYAMANQRGGMAADKGIDWQKFLMYYDLASDAQKAQNRQTDFGQWATAIKTAMAMAAAPFIGGASKAATAPTGGQAGGITGSGGLADWYTKTYGGLGG